MCFYIQFIHSSIQYTETIIYRYIYRISYINLSLLFTAILVWIFHTLSKKKKNSWEDGTYRVHQGVCGARRSLPIAYGGHPGPGRAGQRVAGRACAAGLGDGVGVGLSRAGLRGVAQTPPRCGMGWRRERAAGPSFWGWWGGAGPGCPGLSPSMPQPQACDNAAWLPPWGWGVCP